MSNQPQKTVIVVAFALLTQITFIKTVNADSFEEDRASAGSGLSIQSMNTMRLPDEVKKDLLNQIEQRNHVSVKIQTDSNKFTSLNKIAKVMDPMSKGKASIALSSMAKEGQLITNPSAISQTALRNADLISATPAGVYQNGQWSGLSRLYSTHSMDDLNVVMLDENDYLSVGGRIVMAKEAINESVNHAPAILVVKQSTSGENLIQLTWVTKRKNYVLSSNPTNLEAGKTALLELAKGMAD